MKLGLCLFSLGDFEMAQETLREALLFSRNTSTSSLPDRRQMSELLNNLACLAFLTTGETVDAMNLFRESLEVQLAISEDSVYLGSKFSCQSSALNISVIRANLGFLSLVSRDFPTAKLALESASKSQGVLLRDAHITLTTTMDHLAVVHLMSNNEERGLQLLRRIYHMQIDAFGPNDPRCQKTLKKVKAVEMGNVNTSREEEEPANETQKEESSRAFGLLRSFLPMRK